MAILPTKFSISQQPSGRSGRQIAEYDTSGLGRGMQSLGNSVVSLGSDIQRQQDTVDISRAEASKAQGLIDATNKFTDDPDYSTFKERAPKDTSEVVNNAANLIRNPQMREKWKLQAGTDAARVNDAIGDKARTLGKQADTVAFDDSLETQRRIYVDPQTSDEQKAAARAAIEGSIETGLKTGLLTPGAADARKKQYIEDANFSRAKLAVETNPGVINKPIPAQISDRVGTAMGYFQSHGWSKEQAAGIVGNLVAESQLNTGALNKGDGSDGSDSIGIAQWNSGRAAALKSFAADRGTDWRDFGTQLAFVDHELHTSHKTIGDQLASAKDVQSAAEAGIMFEGPAGSQNGAKFAHNYKGRLSYAAQAAGVDANPDWFKELSPEEKQVVYQQQDTRIKQQQVEQRGNIETVVQNAPSAIQNTGTYSGSTPTQQQFVDAYGPQDGPQKYDAFTASLDVAQSSYNFRTMSADDIQKLVQASVPTSSGNDAALEDKKYAALSQAASQTLAARKADPATYTRQAFPSVDQAWNDAAQSGNYQAAMAATAAAQQQLGMQQMELLPKSIADKSVEAFKNPDATDQQRLGAVTGLILSTPDQGQRQAVFKQLVDAGLPAMTEGVVEAAARGDQGAANRLLQAALVDPAKLPKSGEVKPTDIDDALYSSIWAPGQIGDASYGVGYGDTSSLERAQRGSDLMKKAVQVRISQGQDLQSAVAGASKDLFGDKKVYSGAGSVSANLPVPSDTDTSLLTAGLAAAKTSFKAALDLKDERILNGTKPPPGPTGNFDGMVSKGNIDLAARPVVKNDDGTISTVRSMSFNEDGKEILVPTVSPDGKILSDQEAIDLYHQTGQNLGVFKNSDAADAYATALHDAQAKFYANPSADGTRAILTATFQNRNDDVLNNGVYVPVGNGIGLRDPYTGQFVTGADGVTPLSLPIDKVLAMGRDNPIGGNDAGDRYSAGQANTGLVQPTAVQQYLKGGSVSGNEVSPEASRWMSGQPVDVRPDVKKNSTPDQGSPDLSKLSSVERGFLGALSTAESAGIGGTKLKLYNDIIQRGRTAPITENDLQPDEQEKLKALVLKQGKTEGKIDYKDYIGSGMPEDILGGFRYKVENGAVHITDTYDFNKSKGSSWDDNTLVQALGAFTSPKNLAAAIGRKIAPDSKPGVPVKIILK
ncbi:hypothetical protein G6L12_05885 [Agrobacterium rhizogenes]|nr:hypothetical protein [Rhizobium rhizogenes]NTF74005.1 hypothetical protein [Rhizobium rhizogenes]